MDSHAVPNWKSSLDTKKIPSLPARSSNNEVKKHEVVALRQEGRNSGSEMATSLLSAGFDTWDATT